MIGSVPADDPTPRVLALLRRHGWNATSFQVLEEGFRYWFDGDDACVAYVDTPEAWVAAGAPIAPAEQLSLVAERFAQAAARQHRRALFFGTETRFSRQGGLRTMLIGEQPVWDPAHWAETVARTASLRAQLGRARRKGVTVRAVDAADLADPQQPLRRTIAALVDRWLAARPMAPMGFLVDVQPFSFAAERRYFVAERHGAVVGFLAAVPIYARGGWLFEDLLRDTGTPNGTTELLIDAAMTAVAAEGSRYVTLGLAPLAGPVRGWLGLARRYAAALYDFAGVYGFRARLRPARWDPIYLSAGTNGRSPVLVETVALLDALRAFARGRFFSFGIETLLRGPALVVRVLAALLLPWTALLALVSDRFFPAPAVHTAWVGFDIALAGALFALAARWRRWLAMTLAVAVTADAAATTAQIILYNLQTVAPVNGNRATSIGEAAVLLMGIAAPTTAAVILWNGIGHRRRDRAGAE
ncbi:MAG TPA: DUF2156 domain-containing protein [Polyangia bacterium]|nr:DUF2156 domain-containing protein [Polyangia bacterium]